MPTTVNSLSRIEVRPSQPGDVAYLLIGAPGWLAGANPRDLDACQHAYTFLVDGEIAACYGISFPWPGLADAWAVVHPERVKLCAKTFHKTALSTMRALLDNASIHRIQAYVIREYEIGRRWVRHLGFTAETILEQAGPGREDLVVYCILKKG